ncbi:MAG: ABC transporter permease [Flammeovirgaceae bacterium]|nr:ABC transporter permease [Flammeovirgaceae bacterium]
MKFLYADSNIFDFFSFKLLEGDPHTALIEPNSIVLTSAAAKKYFGDDESLGQIITVGNDNKAFHVTGIAEEPPANSHIQFEILLSSQSDRNMQSDQWTNNGLYTYYRINPMTPVSQVDDKLRELVLKYVGPEISEGFGMSFEEFEKQGGQYGYYSRPFLDSHLYSPEMDDDITPKSDIKYVYIIGAIGLFILIIACINFMNLSTARSSGRAKEVGLRKTLGSVRKSLIFQFLSESFIYVFAATLLAVAAVYLLLPSFNLLAGKDLTIENLFSLSSLGIIASIVLLVGLLAGSYPAFI